MKEKAPNSKLQAPKKLQALEKFQFLKTVQRAVPDFFRFARLVFHWSLELASLELPLEVSA